MSEQAGNTAVGETPPDNTEGVPTLTRHQQLADDFMKGVDSLLAFVPKLETSHRSTAVFVRSHQNVKPEFIRDTIAAVEQNPALRGVNTFDVVAARDAFQFMEAFRPALLKLKAFSDSLQFTIDSKYANLAADSLQMYAIAKGVSRDARGAAVASHVQNLKKGLGRRGPRSKLTVEPPPFVGPSAPPLTK
ncbi:MAG TPA: hypothetical protein VN181_08235 [Thermoanaerobaculia bacterium]|nr:hypothetical protein [Thermoanaerobaculia bacterium]